MVDSGMYEEAGTLKSAALRDAGWEVADAEVEADESGMTLEGRYRGGMSAARSGQVEELDGGGDEWRWLEGRCG